MNMAINILHSGKEWVEAMVQHKCAMGRRYVVNDDTNMKRYGYECNACDEIFRISKADLAASGPKGLILQMKQRDVLAEKISMAKNGSVTTKSKLNTSISHHNKERLLKSGILVRLH